MASKADGSEVSGGSLSLSISASDPQEALEKVRAVSTALKGASERSKD